MWEHFTKIIKTDQFPEILLFPCILVLWGFIFQFSYERFHVRNIKLKECFKCCLLDASPESGLEVLGSKPMKRYGMRMNASQHMSISIPRLLSGKEDSISLSFHHVGEKQKRRAIVEELRH